MAAINLSTGGYPQTATLGVATADTITLPGGFSSLTIINQDATSTLSFRADGTAAVTDAAGTYPVLPKTERTIPVIAKADGSYNTASVISPAAAKYTVTVSLAPRTTLAF